MHPGEKGMECSMTKDANSASRLTTMEGMSLQELLCQYRHFMFDDYLPFMDAYVVDHELGGFFCNTDRAGNTLSRHKRIWFDGRGIWVYSYLYNHVSKNPAYLEIARKTVELTLRMEPSENAFWPGSYSREGMPDPNALADIYGNLFLAEGLGEYARACGDDRYWTKAKHIVLSCMGIYDRNDYVYTVDYGPAAPSIPAPRVLGHWMVFLRAATGLLCINADSELESIATRSVEAIMSYHFNPEYELLNEALHHDMSRPQGPFAQFVYTGHAIETLWMVMDEALRSGNKPLCDLAIERFKRHVEVAWDDVYGGVFHGLNDVWNYKWKLDKVLWAQEEVLIGTMIMIEHTDDPWAHQWFAKMYRYVMKNYPLQKYGYSLWNIGGNRTVSFVKEGVRIENYHHPRHLMLNILSLERIIKAGGTGAC